MAGDRSQSTSAKDHNVSVSNADLIRSKMKFLGVTPADS